MARNPRVSIIIPTYNRVDFILLAIQSVIDQTFEDFELIVSDDASTEDVAGTVRSFNDKRIKYFRQKTNLGFIKNWNFCLNNSKGKYIKIMGDDDVLLPNCLEKSVHILENGDSVGMVCSDYWTIDNVGNFINNSQFNSESFRIFKQNQLENGKQFIKEYFLGRRRVGLPSSILFKKDLLNTVGDFDESMGSPADIDLWLRMLKISDFYYIDEKLLKMRWHKNNPSLKLENDPFSYKHLINLLSKNYYLIKNSISFSERMGAFSIYSKPIVKKIINIDLLKYEKTYLSDLAALIRLLFFT
jgi:glycosyltransferase involved in cell wall biosynthesis